MCDGRGGTESSPGDGHEPETASRPNRKAVVRTATGRSLAYSEAGAGRDVLLIHGTLTTSDDMRLALFDELQRRFRVVAMDRPSRGASDRVAAADASLWSQAAIIRDAAIALGMERPILCGHSYGGAVALAMALALPETVAAVVALAPVGVPEPRLENILFGPRVATGPAAGSVFDPLLLPVLWDAMFLPQAMPSRFAGAFPFGLAGGPEQTLAEGESANVLAVDLLRSMARYATCRVPVTLVTGMMDIVVNPLHSLAASAMIPGSRLHAIPDVGHMLHHSRPHVIAAHIADLAHAS